MKITTLNKVESATKYITNKRVNFEINPLDVGIAKIQHNLQKNLERLIPEHGDFAPVVENYISKDPDIDISEIKVMCRFLNVNAPKKNKRNMELYVTDKARINTYRFVMAQGDKKDMLNVINSKQFFDVCKSVVMCVDEVMSQG